MDQRQAVAQVGPYDAARLLAEGAALIDVREPEEWKIGRAPERSTSRSASSVHG